MPPPPPQKVRFWKPEPSNPSVLEDISAQAPFSPSWLLSSLTLCVIVSVSSWPWADISQVHIDILMAGGKNRRPQLPEALYHEYLYLTLSLPF